MANYFEEQEIGIERVVLAESIVLPKVSKTPLTYDDLESGEEYISPFDAYKDIKAKFYIKILTPTLDTNGVATSSTKTVTTTYKHTGSAINTTKYISANFITLTIPKYILLNFTGTIPKGTEFIVASIGGYMKVEFMRIIGVYSVN